MKYPREYALGLEPEEIRVGDLVWWNEGVCVGFVVDVIRGEEDYQRWGLDEPSIALTQLHPFAANSRHTGFVAMNAADQLEDEGVGPLSDHERVELRWAIAEAKRLAAPQHVDLPFCVSARMDMDRNEEDWHFHFIGPDSQVVETVVFPFRPNTRSKRDGSNSPSVESDDRGG